MPSTKQCAISLLVFLCLNQPSVWAETRSQLQLEIQAVSKTAAGVVSETPLSGSAQFGSFQTTSEDGRFVVFTSQDPNLIPGQSSPSQFGANVFLYDRTTRQTTLVSHSAGHPNRSANGDSTRPVISRNGKFIAFQSTADDLLAGQVNPPLQHFQHRVFLYHRVKGTVQMVSHAFGQPHVGADGFGFLGGISGDGRYVLTTGYASNLTETPQKPRTAGDSLVTQVYLYDRLTNENHLVSRQWNHTELGTVDGAFGGCLSTDGQTVVFLSPSQDLIPDLNRATFTANLFLFDKRTGHTQLVSHTPDSPVTTAKQYSTNPFLSSDGRFCAFTSLDEHLVKGQNDTNYSYDYEEKQVFGFDIFLFDRVTNNISLVSHNAASNLTTGNQEAWCNDLSDDGRYVLFTSRATDLMQETTGLVPRYDQVYRYDRETGTTTLVSHASADPVKFSNERCSGQSISSDGNTIVFTSRADNLVSGQVDSPPITGKDPDRLEGSPDVFAYRFPTDRSHLLTHQESQPNIAAGGGGSGFSNPLGTVFFFSSNADNLVSQVDQNRKTDLFTAILPDLATVLLTRVVPGRTSQTAMLGGTTGDSQPTTSRDGRFVVFSSRSPDLTPYLEFTSTNPADQSNVFVFDRETNQVTLVSHAFGSGDATGNRRSEYPTISGDGSVVVFRSSATNLLSQPLQEQTPSDSHLFLYELKTGQIKLVDHRSEFPLQSGNGLPLSRSPSVSADGRWVVFASTASDLVPGQVDTNRQADVFLYDRERQTIGLISHQWNQPLTAGSAASTNPIISANGQVIVFESLAEQLIPNYGSTYKTQLYAYDREQDRLELISHRFSSASTAGNGAVASATVSDDGNWIAYNSQADDLVSGFVKNNTVASVEVYVHNRKLVRNQLVSHIPGAATTAGNDYSYRPLINGDGTTIAFQSRAGNLIENQQFRGQQGENVFSYGVATGTNRLVSHLPAETTVTGNRTSSVQSISTDGRRIVFASLATNLVPNQIDSSLIESVDEFLYDLETDSVTLITRWGESPQTTVPASPFVPGTYGEISGNGEFVVFASSGSTFIARDYNFVTDVFLARVLPSPPPINK